MSIEANNRYSSPRIGPGWSAPKWTPPHFSKISPRDIRWSRRNTVLFLLLSGAALWSVLILSTDRLAHLFN